MKIPVIRNILSANDQVAQENRNLFRAERICVLNLMSSPGAGKTSLILATAARLPADLRPAVIEGDLASRIDAEKVAEHGIPVVQINTGGNCHLDAPMVRSALAELPLADIDLLFIENVGNLVCPAEFDLGADLAIVVASTPEGHDKPYKYPGMFAVADAVVLNKADVMSVFEFDLDFFRRGVQMVNARAPLFVVSCKTGAGLEAWTEWLVTHSNLSNAGKVAVRMADAG